MHIRQNSDLRKSDIYLCYDYAGNNGHSPLGKPHHKKVVWRRNEKDGQKDCREQGSQVIHHILVNPVYIPKVFDYFRDAKQGAVDNQEPGFITQEAHQTKVDWQSQ